MAHEFYSGLKDGPGYIFLADKDKNICMEIPYTNMLKFDCRQNFSEDAFFGYDPMNPLYSFHTGPQCMEWEICVRNNISDPGQALFTVTANEQRNVEHEKLEALLE